MGRSSGRSSSSSRSSSTLARAPPPAAKAAPPPARTAPPPAAPAPAAPAPAPVVVQSGGGGGLLSGIMQGMAFGAGSQIGREVVGSIMGGGRKESEPAPAPAPVQAAPRYQAPGTAGGPCELDQTAFFQCLQQNPGNASHCDSFFQALQQCQSSL